MPSRAEQPAVVKRARAKTASSARRSSKPKKVRHHKNSKGLKETRELVVRSESDAKADNDLDKQIAACEATLKACRTRAQIHEYLDAQSRLKTLTAQKDVKAAPIKPEQAHPSRSSSTLSPVSTSPLALRRTPKAADYVDQDVCPRCLTPRILTPETSRLCCANKKCAISVEYRQNSTSGHGEEAITHTSPPQDVKKAYRKFLAPFVEGSPEVPREVFDEIRLQLTKLHAASVWEVRSNDIKEILSQLRLTQWKNYALKIARILRGESVAKLSKEVAEALVTMYEKSQNPFNQVKAPTKRNFVQKAAFTCVFFGLFSPLLALIAAIGDYELSDCMRKRARSS